MVLFISILIISLTATGQIFLKIGADTEKGTRIINIYVVSGYACFGLTIVLSYFFNGDNQT